MNDCGQIKGWRGAVKKEHTLALKGTLKIWICRREEEVG
jgi:hypothetical protein